MAQAPSRRNRGVPLAILPIAPSGLGGFSPITRHAAGSSAAETKVRRSVMSWRNLSLMSRGSLPVLLLAVACGGEDATVMRALGDGRFEQPLDPALGTEAPRAFGG